MELPSKILEQIAFNSRSRVEEHILIVMDKSTHEEHLSQPLQTNNKQFKIALTFLTGYNGIFNLTNSNNKFYFKKFITNEDGFIKSTIPPGAYQLESLNNEKKRLIVDEGHYSDNEYPFTIKPNFSTLGSIIEISPQRPIFGFMFDDSIRDLLGFNATISGEDYNLSQNPVDILSIDNIFFECDIVQVMIFKSKRSGMFHNFTTNVDPGYKYIEKFRGGVQWFMMESKDFISSVCFKFKTQNNQIVLFNDQSITFRLSIKEVSEKKVFST